MNAYSPVAHLRLSAGDRWMFRWRFEYLDGRSKKGIWNGTSRFEDTASAQNKEGLLAAIIEGKHFLRRDVRIFSECPGADFINFEHLAVYVSNQNRPFTYVYGIRLRTRSMLISCFADGSVKKDDWRADSSYRFPEWTAT